MDAASRSEHPTIFFDGACTLCNGAVQTILALDRDAVFRFAALQSATARNARGPGGDAFGDTIVLLDGGRRYLRSDAVVRIGFALPWPWPALAAVANAVPRELRDAAYDWIARNRYRLFGQRAECIMPSPAQQARFLP